MKRWEYKSVMVDVNAGWAKFDHNVLDATLNQWAADGWQPADFVSVGKTNQQVLVILRRELQGEATAAIATTVATNSIVKPTQAPIENRWYTAEKTLIIGHRGASADAPENTLKAFRLAKEQGADGIEFDVQLSADNIPIVIHDDTLERTTSGTGFVRDWHSADLFALDAGGGEPIPSLPRVVATCGTDFLYNVEIKEEGERGVMLAVAIAETLNRMPSLAPNILISSFHHEVLPAVREHCPHPVAIAAIRNYPETPFPEWLHGQADHPHFSMVNADHMVWARENNLKINVWTVDDPAEAQRLIKLGVNGVVTNRPADLRGLPNL